jgi:hypothetical protein
MANDLAAGQIRRRRIKKAYPGLWRWQCVGSNGGWREVIEHTAFAIK